MRAARLNETPETATGTRSAPRRYQRRPRKGEERRRALLAVLGELLESQPLATIEIADITRAADVSRSAFYFYFPTKAAAVAALLEGLYQELVEASGKWHGLAGAAREELRPGFDAVVSFVRGNSRLIVAMADAAAADAEVREWWESWFGEVASRVASKIIEERDAGCAPPGVDANAVAAALVAMNERALEREARAVARGQRPSDVLTDALCEVWRRAIYGTEG